MKSPIRFMGDMVAIPTDAAIVLFTRAEFLAALQAEQRRRQRAQHARTQGAASAETVVGEIR